MREKRAREDKQRDLFKKRKRQHQTRKALMVPVCVLCGCCDRLEIRDCAVSKILQYITTVFVSATLNISEIRRYFFKTFEYFHFQMSCTQSVFVNIQ